MPYKTKEQQLEYVRQWRKNNKEKTKKYNQTVRSPRKKLRRKELKETGIKKLGGKCCKCGYNKCKDALDFHHVQDKEYEISRLIRDLETIKFNEEIKKCILVCSNCHREIHSTGY